MTDFQCIECDEAKQRLAGDACLLDIRDSQSFNQAHPQDAINLNNDNLQQILTPLAKDQVILVLCYHGISSQNAAQFISSQGFTNVASINGGFEAWQTQFPENVTSNS
jgi:thiosulfate sulfurtransferase